MGRGDLYPIRALPRAFVPGLGSHIEPEFVLPKEEYDKFHKVLRLASGEHVAIMPGDGRLIRCELRGRGVVVLDTHFPETESKTNVTLGLALSKPESLEESVRMATEIGVRKFILFPSDRTVVKWDSAKVQQKVDRLKRISREAAEVSFRTRLPSFEIMSSLFEMISKYPDSVVLSETQGLPRTLVKTGGDMTIVIGPEGGWAPREVEAIGDRAVTLGPRVLRVDTAVSAACSLVLLP